MDAATKKKLITASAPYLQRMYKLLSHSGIQLDLQLADFGDEFLAFVEVNNIRLIFYLSLLLVGRSGISV